MGSTTPVTPIVLCAYRRTAGLGYGVCVTAWRLRGSKYYTDAYLMLESEQNPMMSSRLYGSPALQDPGHRNLVVALATTPAARRLRGGSMLSRSRNSSSGIAYLREMPVHSLNSGTLKRSPLCARQQLAQLPDRRLVKHQIFAERAPAAFRAAGSAAANARAPAPRRISPAPPPRRHGQSGLFEGPLDLRPRLLLVLFQHHLMRPQPHDLAFRAQSPWLRPAARPAETAARPHSRPRRSWRGNAGQQRMLLVKLAHRLHHALARRLQPRAVHIPGLRLRNGHQRRARCRRGDLGRASIRCAPPDPPYPCRTALRAPAARCARRHPASDSVSSRAVDVVALAIAAARRIHHHAAADRHHRREHADDEAVAGQQQRRLPQHQAHIRGSCPGCIAAVPSEQPHFGFDLRRARMEVHRRAVLQGLRRSAADPAGNRAASPRGNGRARSGHRRAPGPAARYPPG